MRLIIGFLDENVLHIHDPTAPAPGVEEKGTGSSERGGKRGGGV